MAKLARPCIMITLSIVQGCCTTPEDTCEWATAQGRNDAFEDLYVCADYGTSLEQPLDTPNWWDDDYATICYTDEYEQTWDLFYGDYCD